MPAPRWWLSVAILLSGCRDVGDPGGADPVDAAAIAADARPDHGAELWLMTWNLEVFPKTAETAGEVARLLGELAPDLVAVQEIADPAAFDRLVESLPGYRGVLNDDPDAFQRVGLIYREGRVTVDAVDTLFAGDWYPFPRPPLAARLSALGFDFVLLVVHLKAQLDDESQDRRRQACERLDQWVRAEQAAGAEQDFAVAGDFNDEITDSPTYNVFGPLLDESAYRFLTADAAAQRESTYIPFSSFIDHVVVTSDLLGEYGDGVTEVLALDREVDGYEDRVSDHRPVLVRFAPAL